MWKIYQAHFKTKILEASLHKNASKTFKYMTIFRESSDVTLISEDSIMFQAHKVLLASNSPLFKNYFNSNNFTNQVAHNMSLISSEKRI